MSYNNKIHIETLNLFRAIRNDESLDMIQMLLRKPKTQVNYFLSHCSKETTCPLILSMVLGNINITRILLNDNRININITDPYGSSSLIIILLNKEQKEFQDLKHIYIKIIELLLTYESFDINIVNNFEKTALSLAIEKDIEEVVKMLLEHPKINIIQPTESIVNISNNCNNKNIQHYLNSYIVKNQSTLDQQFEEQIADNYGDLKKMFSTLRRFDKICSECIIENFKDLIKQFLNEKIFYDQHLSNVKLELETSNLNNKNLSKNKNKDKEKSKFAKKQKRREKKNQLRILQIRNKFWNLSLKKKILHFKKETKILNNWNYLANRFILNQFKQNKERYKLFLLREKFQDLNLKLILLTLKKKIDEFKDWYNCNKWNSLAIKIKQNKVKQKYNLRKQYILARCKIYNLITLNTFNKLCSYCKNKKIEKSLVLCSLQAARKVENKQLLDSMFKFKQYIYEIKLQKKQQNLIDKFKQSNNVKHLRYIFINLKKYLQYQKNKKSISDSSFKSNKYQERPNSKFVWIEDYEHPKSWYIVEENYYLQLVESQNYYYHHLGRKDFQNYNYYLNQNNNHIIYSR